MWQKFAFFLHCLIIKIIVRLKLIFFCQYWQKSLICCRFYSFFGHTAAVMPKTRIGFSQKFEIFGICFLCMLQDYKTVLLSLRLELIFFHCWRFFCSRFYVISGLYDRYSCLKKRIRFFTKIPKFRNLILCVFY